MSLFMCVVFIFICLCTFFLLAGVTHKTTCASEMLEKTTCQKICQKNPYGWRHVWPGDTWNVPLGPTPAGACRHSQSRHVAWLVAAGPAAIAVAGAVVSSRSPCLLGHVRQVARLTQLAWAHGTWSPPMQTLKMTPTQTLKIALPATAMAAGPAATSQATCRLWLWRHAPAGVGPDGSLGQTCRHP
jgi:hypothetical protein